MVTRRQPHLGPSKSWNTKEGWKDWVRDGGSKPPKMPSMKEWDSMSPSDRQLFDAARDRHHNSFGPVVTDPMRQILDVLEERVSINKSERPGARCGVVIDGDPTVGKSTLAAYFGREYERAQRSDHGSEWAAQEESEWHPVVFHSLDTPTTVKNLNRGIANFYGAVVPARASTAWLTDVVREHAHICGTSVFIIDDIHYLDWNRESTREVKDHLKMLANETAATFIYAGVDCEETKLLTEGRGKNSRYGQTRRRFTLTRLEPFEIRSEGGRREWMTLLYTLEKNLVLRNAEPGMLVGMDEYIHALTGGGYFGSLMTLVRTAAYRAIRNGLEKITPELLRGIPRDHAATEDFPALKRARNGSRTAGQSRL